MWITRANHRQFWPPTLVSTAFNDGTGLQLTRRSEDALIESALDGVGLTNQVQVAFGVSDVLVVREYDALSKKKIILVNSWNIP